MITNRSLAGGEMKYFKRLKIYKASNCTYDPLTKVSTSYGWWLVTRQVNGVLLFNNYRYSVSTSGHQRKIRDMINKTFTKIGLEVQAPDGLQNLDSCLAYHKNLIKSLQEEILKPRSKKETNIIRMDAILENKKIVEKLQELIK